MPQPDTWQASICIALVVFASSQQLLLHSYPAATLFAGTIEMIFGIQAELRQKSSQREQLVLAQRLFGLEAVSYPALAQVQAFYPECMLHCKRQESVSWPLYDATCFEAIKLCRSLHQPAVLAFAALFLTLHAKNMLPAKAGTRPAADAQKQAQLPQPGFLTHTSHSLARFAAEALDQSSETLLWHIDYSK